MLMRLEFHIVLSCLFVFISKSSIASNCNIFVGEFFFFLTNYCSPLWFLNWSYLWRREYLFRQKSVLALSAIYCRWGRLFDTHLLNIHLLKWLATFFRDAFERDSFYIFLYCGKSKGLFEYAAFAAYSWKVESTKEAFEITAGCH